jgi:hypothetical protein
VGNLVDTDVVGVPFLEVVSMAPEFLALLVFFGFVLLVAVTVAHVLR